MPVFHPDLRAGRFLPRITAGPRLVRLLERAGARRDAPVGDGVVVTDVEGPEARLRLYRPATPGPPAPALLWIHGGGYVMGRPQQDQAANVELVRDLGITVAAVHYRLAPAHPAPAALEDVHAGLRWLAGNADAHGIDPARIAIGGASAGGGLAAALALYAHDRGEITPAFQLLVYPMLDDRTVLRDAADFRDARMWSPASNRYGWTSYLGAAPGGPDVPPYAAPARREDLAGLPPAWIGVGTLDVFHDEDLAYARRLEAAGVPCELCVVPGAFHGFDAVFRNKPVSRRFRAAQAAALRAALLTPAP